MAEADGCIDVRVACHHSVNNEDHYLLSIHMRLRAEEISCKTIKALKEEVIQLFRDSFRLSFEFEDGKGKRQGQKKETRHNETGAQQQRLFSEDFCKLLFARHRQIHTYLPLDAGDVYSMDHDTYDIVFVIIERARRQMDTSSSSSSSPSLFPTGLAQPDKLCLVYIVEDDGFSLKIPVERIFWLLEEERYFGKAIWDIVDESLVSKFDTQIDAKIPNITMTLQYAHLLPPQPISIEITEIIDRKDKNDRPYLMYSIRAYIEPLTWVVQRRFSDFKTLHTELQNQPSSEIGYIPRSSLPAFPQSKVTVNNSCQESAQKRRQCLQEYLLALMNIAPDEVASNVHVLTFLGAIRTTKPVQAKNTKQNRNVVNLDNVQKSLGHLNTSTLSSGYSPSALLNWGDLVLFRSVAFAGTLQRLATGSEFDHVGIIVPSRFASSHLLLLESTSEGVTIFPLGPRLQAYDYYKVSQYIVVRRLLGERSKDQYNTLLDFVDKVEGMPYSFNISSLFAGLRSKQPSSNMTTDESEFSENSDKRSSPLSQSQLPSSSKTSQHKSFFCSELVAAVLMAINIIPSTVQADTYWPGSFAMAKELDAQLLKINSTYKYGEEIAIDFNVMDIGRAQSISPRVSRYGTRPQPVIHLDQDVKSTFSSSEDDDDNDNTDDDDDDGDREIMTLRGTLQGMEVKESDPIEVEGGTNIEIQFSKPKATFQPSLL